MDGFWHWQGHGGPMTVLALTLVFGLALVVLALWLALPFAVFGTRRTLRDLLAAQRETNQRLDDLRRALESRPPRPPGAPDT
ncbi:MAG: hypothetical protein ACYDA8_12175 [Deferrisomatales bacterium]